MTKDRTNRLRSLSQPNNAVASLENEMPLLVAIGKDMGQPQDDLIKLLPAARRLLDEAFRAIDRSDEVMQREVA